MYFSQGGGRPVCVGSSKFGRWLLNLLGGSCVNLFWLGKLGGDNCHSVCECVCSNKSRRLSCKHSFHGAARDCSLSCLGLMPGGLCCTLIINGSELDLMM